MADPEASLDEARLAAHRLAFAPLIFQAARVLRDIGALERARDAGIAGVTCDEIATTCGVTRYAAELLLESGLAAELLHCEERPQRRAFIITTLGVIWLRDPLTRTNADFVHHVCYRGAFDLGAALRAGLPAGLPTISAAPTVYEGLATLSPEVRAAWLAFDHTYSDGVFESCLDALPVDVRRLVDIGGNTGRFASLVVRRRSDVDVTLVDLPGQVALARSALAVTPGAERIGFLAADVLGPDLELPSADAYWMSQFLDCFSESQIVAILERVRRAMPPAARVYIVETFWDRQRHPAARHCVIATSLYFACIANGQSRMYHSEDFAALVERAGLVVERATHDLGLSHSLLVCRPA